MFTGLIEQVGRLAGIQRVDGGCRVRVEHEPWHVALMVGESVAVNGVCLTTVTVERGWFAADLLAETIRRTALLERDGKPVNLERAVRADGRFGGHFVTGHVDGTGTVADIAESGRDRIVSVRCLPDVLAEVAVKGSIACDGVSLTVARVDDASFDVHLIPHTWEHTAFRDARGGSRVNLETDIIAKYVRRAMASAGGGKGISEDDLRKAGILHP